MDISVFITFLLVIIDIICFTLLNIVNIYNLSFYYVIPIMVLYSTELLLFLWGLRSNNIAVLNITWALFSFMCIIISGFLFYKYSLTNIQLVAFIFGAISILLFLFSNTQYIR